MSERIDKIKFEISSKESDLARQLKNQENLRSELSIIDEKLDLLKERTIIQNNELNSRKRKHKELKKQTEKVISQVKDDGNYLDNPLPNELLAENDVRRKLLTILTHPQENDSDINELFFFDGQKTELKSNIVIHTVKIKLVQPVPITDRTRENKQVPREATFRIDKKITFEDLKIHACNHWVSSS